MGKMIDLTAADGHKLSAYRADPSGKPRGGIVVIQEIFGVNSHIKSVADGFAAGETVRANRGLAGAARELGLVLELDRRLVALDRGPSRCDGVAETVRRLGPRLEEAERGRRWQEVATLLAEELVPALRATPADG